MLEVYSPVPLSEGEPVIGGLNTKHLVHFGIGLVISSPLVLLALWLLPHFGVSRWTALGLGGAVGSLFALTQWNDVTLSEIMWLTLRYTLRPRHLIFDRSYRQSIHRIRRNSTGEGNI